MKEREAEKEQELSTKDKELKEALESQQAASKAIKDASTEKESLSQVRAHKMGEQRSEQLDQVPTNPVSPPGQAGNGGKDQGPGDRESPAAAGRCQCREGHQLALLRTCSASAQSQILTFGGPKQVGKLEEELKGLKKKLSKEQDARELVLKLRKEKEELKLQLEEERKNIYYQAKEVWIPQATESLKNFTSTAQDTATKVASQLHTSLAEAEKTVAEQLNELDKHEHVETARKTVKPVLQDARKQASNLITQVHLLKY